MSNDDMHTYQAALKARTLTETLFRADAIERYADRPASYHFSNADNELRDLAKHLGYDLVKREREAA